MTSNLETAKSILSPPGDTLQEHLDFIGMSQAELAERMGRPKEKINDIIKAREPITVATAFKLEKVLGIPANFWLNREKTYRQELYELEEQEKFYKMADWLNHFPVKELTKLGWMPETNEKHVLVDSLLKFFGIASPEEWEKIYIKNEISVAFRISLAYTKSPYAISAWLRIGEHQTKELKLDTFDKKKFKNSLSTIKEIAYSAPDDYSRKLQKIAAQCGVAVVFTPTLPKAPISGSSRWIYNKPLIQLSDRFKTNDHFWFTFFHEAAHIILHGKKDIFLEFADSAANSKEEEANAFAEKMLLSDEELNEILQYQTIAESDIESFAEKFLTPPACIVGRLQHLKKVPFSFGNGFKQKIEIFK